MVTLPVGDVHTVVVGSLGAFRHKLRMANDKGYRERAFRKQWHPRTLREVLGLDSPARVSRVVGTSQSIGGDGSGTLVFSSMSAVLGLEGAGSIRDALGLT